MKTSMFVALLAVGSVVAALSCIGARFAAGSIGAPWKKPWNPAGRAGAVMLGGARAIRGGHCESSAILNALAYEGYPFAECEIAGGGGALAFVFQKGTFPFLGGRNEDMKERFFAAADVAWHRGNAEAPDSGWAEIIRLLEAGHPVVVRNDMRYLGYRYDGKRGGRWSSFGGHYVTLFGLDFDRDLAFVSDTEYDAIQTVSLAEFHRARLSRTRVFPPKGEFYWIERAPAGYAVDPGRLARSGLAGALSALGAEASGPAGGESTRDGAIAPASVGDTTLVGIAGMERYPEALRTMGEWGAKPFLLPAVLSYMAGNIEDFGTGGASFRCFFREFAELESSRGVRELDPLVPLLDASIGSWHALAADFRVAAGEIRGKRKPDRDAVLARLATEAEALYRNEKALYTGLEAASKAMGASIMEE